MPRTQRTDADIMNRYLRRDAAAPLSPARQRRVDHIFAPHATRLVQMMDARGSRLDSPDGALVLARQLEDLDTEVYFAEYPENVGLQILPVRTLDAGFASHTYQSRDRTGSMARANAVGNDSPRLGLVGGYDTIPLRSWTGHYAYSVDDLRRMALAGGSLEADNAMAAREQGEAEHDSILAVGDTSQGIYGMFNNPNVGGVSPAVGSWELVGTDADEIVQDLEKVKADLISGNKGKRPNALILTHTQYTHASTKRLSGTDVTALSFFSKNNPDITIHQWHRGETAGASSVRRLMMGRLDRRVLEAVIPIRWNALPPEIRGREYRVECEIKSGGVLFRYPNEWRYSDGC
jgi:hypothetical protein